MSETPRVERAAIVGTAETWHQTPWNDPSLRIICLNDAWVMKPPRADEWYDLHPFDHFWTPDPKVKMEIPDGMYARPVGHVDRLKEMAVSIPVWMQTVPEGWSPNAHPFPFDALREKYGDYFASTPAWQALHLYERGCRELHVYGVHLQSQQEYVEQRPNFEMILGWLMGKGVKVVLPQGCPLLKHPWLYALQPRPQPKDKAQQIALAKLKQERESLTRNIVAAKWYDTRRDEWRKALRTIDAQIADVKQQLFRVQSGASA